MNFLMTFIVFRMLFWFINTVIEIAVWLVAWVFRIAVFLLSWGWHKVKAHRQVKADEMEYTL